MRLPWGRSRDQQSSPFSALTDQVTSPSIGQPLAGGGGTGGGQGGAPSPVTAATGHMGGTVPGQGVPGVSSDPAYSPLYLNPDQPLGGGAMGESGGPGGNPYEELRRKKTPGGTTA